jgi:hypothetical protein
LLKSPATFCEESGQNILGYLLDFRKVAQSEKMPTLRNSPNPVTLLDITLSIFQHVDQMSL